MPPGIRPSEPTAELLVDANGINKWITWRFPGVYAIFRFSQCLDCRLVLPKQQSACARLEQRNGSDAHQICHFDPTRLNYSPLGPNTELTFENKQVPGFLSMSEIFWYSLTPQRFASSIRPIIPHGMLLNYLNSRNVLPWI
jgi:hypothetical protein